IAAAAFPTTSNGASPISFVDPNDGTARRLVATQQGRIFVWNGWRILTTPFLDLTSKVLFGGERGLLALALAPDYATSGRFYVYYTTQAVSAGLASGDIVIERYQRSAGDENLADPTATKVLVINHSSQNNHNGGW